MRPALDRWRHEPGPDLWPDIQRRLELGAEVDGATLGPRRLTPGRVTALFVAAAVAGLGVWAVVQMTNLTGREDSSGRGGELGPIARIEVGGPPQPIAVGQGAAWVHVGMEDGSEQLWRVDSQTGEAVRVPGLVGVRGLAAGREGVWVGLCTEESDGGCPGGKIVRIDPISLRVLAEIPTRVPLQIATSEGYVWADIVDDDGERKLLKIDSETNNLVGRFGCCWGLLAAGEGAVWVAQHNILARIDPVTGEVTARVGLNDQARTQPVNACRLAVGEGAVWVSTCDGGSDLLLRIDPATLEVTRRIRFEGLPRLAVGEGWLWVAEQRLDGNGYALTLFRYDPRTLDRERTIDLSSEEPPQFSIIGPGSPPLFLDAGEGAVWVSDFARGEVIRIDTR
jgi:hypothetical protein